MEVYKIHISSWTASFRYPNLISGYQPSLEVPPISTVLGIINAAAGSYQVYSKFKIGYYFEYEAKAVDLETIYMIEGKNGKPSNNAKSNVIKREFLLKNSLFIYIEDEKIADFFLKPYYPLLLGRSNDLATVENIKSLKKKIRLEPITDATKIKGQIVPFTKNHLPGQIQALPKYFSNTFPRNSLGTEPYSVISYKYGDLHTGISAYRDKINDKKFIDIYFHEVDFNEL